jgi:3-oxoacyl-[acyl-carrier-protein] synthase II
VLILLDIGVRASWNRLLAGKTGIVSLQPRGPQFAPIPSQVAGLVPRGLKAEGGWTPDEWLEKGVRFQNLELFVKCKAGTVNYE